MSKYTDIIKWGDNMPISIKVDIGYTSKSVEFYERYKEAFGKVISAEMISEVNKFSKVNKLILANNREEQLIFEGGLTAGYRGEGPSGTYRVLQMAGFDIGEEFIQQNSSFKLKK